MVPHVQRKKASYISLNLLPVICFSGLCTELSAFQTLYGDHLVLGELTVSPSTAPLVPPWTPNTCVQMARRGPTLAPATYDLVFTSVCLTSTFRYLCKTHGELTSRVGNKLRVHSQVPSRTCQVNLRSSLWEFLSVSYSADPSIGNASTLHQGMFYSRVLQNLMKHGRQHLWKSMDTFSIICIFMIFVNALWILASKKLFCPKRNLSSFPIMFFELPMYILSWITKHFGDSNQF